VSEETDKNQETKKWKELSWEELMELFDSWDKKEKEEKENEQRK
jgi:anaerobic selenocysteine-containing dehydrogenase